MSLGVRARLLLAFFAISAFAILAAAAGLHAFREVGARLNAVDSRIPPTLAAHELSRAAERIIAVAPALLAASDRPRRDEVNAKLAAEIEQLDAKLRALKNEGTQDVPLGNIERIASLLTGNLAELDALVLRRLELSEQIAGLRRKLFETSSEAQRLLGPWLEVLDKEVAALAATDPPGPSSDHTGGSLATLVALQRSTQIAQLQVAATVDMLAEASTTEHAGRLPILDFQLDLAQRELTAIAGRLDPKLRPFFVEQVSKLNAFVSGPSAVTEIRKQELALVGGGEKLVAETRRLSAQLTAGIDDLTIAAKNDIGAAIRDALSVQRTSAQVLVIVVLLSLLTSVLIVWKYVGGNIVRRLTTLSDSMVAIAAGRLDTPVTVKGADEITVMSQAVEIFRRNTLERDELLSEKAQAADLLERKVEKRTAELAKSIEELRALGEKLETANKYKSHFLASASHDLRQPLHALNLFVAQMRATSEPKERDRLAERIEAASGSMNELFDALLDMSKLEAGILQPVFAEFPIERVFKRVETTFAGAARAKGLRLTIVPSSAWLRSDFILLERILFNLVSNAISYTQCGRVLIGVRRRGEQLRIEVCDTGPGIPPDQHEKVFGEFFQLAESDRRGGLGLGLAIVDRLGQLLDHKIELHSELGRGSRFCISIASVPQPRSTDTQQVPHASVDPARGKLVVVIDDDALVLEGMSGILASWGCTVVAAETGEAALRRLKALPRRPDLIIADYRLANGKTGPQAINHLRDALGLAIPAFLISGDTAPERLRDSAQNGYPLLQKPVAPVRLRAMINQLLKAPSHETADV